MSEVFISYARSTDARAAGVAEALRAQGFSVWRDEQLPAHLAYSDVIEERLTAAKAVLVLWSVDAAHSEWVRSEANRARATRKLVQATLDGAPMPMPFEQIQCADLRDWTGERGHPGWRKVVASVAELVGGAGRGAGGSQSPEARVNLATEPDFRLGDLEVSPSGCRVRRGGQEQKLEPRVMEVLTVLARHPDETVTREVLIETCWGGRAVTDDAVSRVLAQVRALARGFEPPPFALETVPKVGVRLVTAAEAAEGGSARAGAVAAPAARRWSRKWLAVGGATALAAAIALGWIAWRQAPSEPNPAFGKPIRAEVMAFEARRPDADLQRIAAAASQAAVLRMTRAGMSTGQTPVARDGGGGDAEFRIIGWVDRRGPDVVLDSQLIDRRSGQVLWSGHEEQMASLGDDLADGAGGAVAFVMQCALADRRISRAGWSTEVVGLYFNVCDALGSPDRMVAAGHRLVAAAPRMAGAHAMLAIALASRGEMATRAPADRNADRTAALTEANAALALDPRWPKAFLAREMSRGAGHWLEREGDLKAAVALDPDLPPPQLRYSALLREVGRAGEATTMAAGTASLGDPRSGDSAYIRLAELKASYGDLDGADEAIQAVGEASDAARHLRWRIASSWRPPAGALAVLRQPGEGPRDPRTRACLERYLGALVAQQASHAALRGLPAECAQVEPSERTRMLAREGDLDGAFAMIDAKPMSRFDVEQLFFIDMKLLRADPRFMRLAARLGLADYWRRSGRWPDFCQAADRPYDCQAQAARASASAPPRTAGR